MSTEIFLKLGTIKGGAAAASYKDQIVVESWGFGVQNSADLHSGSSANVGSKPKVTDIELTKWFDMSSPNLLDAACHRTYYDDATLTMVSNGIETSVIKLTKGVVVVSYEIHNHMGPRMSETVHLHFGEFDVSFQPLDEKGQKKGGAISAKYNIAAPAKK